MSTTTATRVSLSELDILLASRFTSIKAMEAYGLRKFPTSEQYHELAAQLAALPLSRPMVPYVLAQRDWHIRGQTGCMFARLAAHQSLSLRWEYIVSDYMVGHNDYTESVETLLQDSIRDGRVEVISILFPFLREPSDIEIMLRNLVARTSFWFERDEVVGDHHHLHLRYPVSEVSHFLGPRDGLT